MSHPLLQVQGVSKRFGGVQALSDVGLNVQAGQVHGLIGPNGAGKTTFFNTITGLVPVDAGPLRTRWPRLQAQRGALGGQGRHRAHFQNIRLFADMTALDNVRVGRHVRSRVGWWQAVLRTRAFLPRRATHHREGPRAAGLRRAGQQGEQTARTLSYGDQRRLEIARALATEPSCWRSTSPPPA